MPTPEFPRSPEAQHALDAVVSILTDKPRPLLLSPMALEITRRDLHPIAAAVSTKPAASRMSSDHVAHSLYQKLAPVATQAFMSGEMASVPFTGRELDYVTTTLVPYTPDEKDKWIDKRVNQLIDAYKASNPHEDPESLKAHMSYARILALTQLGVREGIIREMHEAYEKTGERRQSFIERIKLFELEEA